MDTATFRWILIGIGLLIVIGVLLFSRSSERKRRPRKSRRKPVHGATASRREPTLGPVENPGDSNTAEAPDQGELNIESAAGGSNHEPMPTPDKIVTLYLQARDNHTIAGVDLLDAALKAGLEFGSMSIFHRKLENEHRPVFSLANLTHPGHFDKDTWNTFETRGVALFMMLPSPISALDTWDAMLATARNLGERLHADILDDAQSSLTRQRSAQIREEMRQYDRKNEPVDL